MSNLISRLTNIRTWHFLWISVIAAEVFTLAVSIIQESLFWGHITKKVLLIGAVDALLVDAVIIAVAIPIISKIGSLERELKIRSEAEDKIRVMAYYDSLTKLPNRVFFKKLLEKAIDFAERQGFSMAVLFIDLDYFKRINDTLGHSEGDKLLQMVTDRLLKITRSSDYIARWDDSEVADVMSRLGGDEFILLLHKVADPRDAGYVARRILMDIAEPFILDAREVFVTASVGIAVFPSDGHNADDLLKNADVAMYHAKSRGRNNYQYYTSLMTEAAIKNLTLRNLLHKAIENGEFILYYQLKQSLAKDSISGVEALLRWKSAERGVVSPAEFISLMEETGLIINVGEWVLRNACRQTVAWHEAGYSSLTVSVNLSARQFDQENLVEVITSALDESGLIPELLELEITESVIMNDPREAINILHELKKMGVKISIDDFGTGYSSLNYLRQLPLDFLKIDRSFVKNIAMSSSDEAIIKTIIALAHSLGIGVVAEGVETEEQYEFLRKCSCDEVQGFLLSPPRPAGEIEGLLQKNSR